MFRALKLTKNANCNEWSYSGYEIWLDSHSIFPIPNFDWGKNAVLFGIDMSSSVHANSKNKNILIFGKGKKRPR